MGEMMAEGLLKADHQLTVYDLRQEAAANLRSMGAQWADSPRAVADVSDAVFTSLPGPKEVEQVVFEPDKGLLAGLRPGSVYMDTTTNSPALFRKIAEACEARGVDALDTPVSGRPPTLAMMVGGKREVFDRYRPLLENVAQNVFYMGDTGTGMVAKGINQFLIFAGFLVGAEGMLIGAKAGIDVNTLYQAMDASAGGRSVRLDAFPRTVFPGAFGRDVGGGGPLDRWAKDVGCAGETARDVGLSAPILEIAEDLLRQGQAQGLGDQVWYSIIQVLEQMAGLQLRTPTSRG
jgi:3-hydroxyisobutyrate dehydrogenase-like beta-hydroxyacid dehydrogenase